MHLESIAQTATLQPRYGDRSRRGRARRLSDRHRRAAHGAARQVDVYYGMADERIGLASLSLDARRVVTPRAVAA